MNYELRLKVRKVLKEEYLKGKITKLQYESELGKLRPKKEIKEETLINKIKNKIMKTLKTLTVALVLGLSITSCKEQKPVESAMDKQIRLEDEALAKMKESAQLEIDSLNRLIREEEALGN